MKQGAAYAFVADMDVDCDGIDHACKVIPGIMRSQLDNLNIFI